MSTDHTNSASGLAQGGLGGPEDRAEVENGRTEHHSNTQTTPSPTEIQPSSPNADSGAAEAPGA